MSKLTKGLDILASVELDIQKYDMQFGKYKDIDIYYNKKNNSWSCGIDRTIYVGSLKEIERVITRKRKRYLKTMLPKYAYYKALSYFDDDKFQKVKLLNIVNEDVILVKFVKTKQVKKVGIGRLWKFTKKNLVMEEKINKLEKQNTELRKKIDELNNKLIKLNIKYEK